MALIDEQIQEAIRKGQFTDLPGAGKPLKLDDDRHTPEHLRMAHKLLRENELVPDWMTQGKELDAAREKLIGDIRRAVSDRIGALNDSVHFGVEAQWQVRVAGLREAAQKHNSQVLSYNLKVPRGVAHKPHLNFEAELARQA